MCPGMKSHGAMASRTADIAEYRKHGYGIRKRMMLPRATGQEAIDDAFQGSDRLIREKPFCSTAKTPKMLLVDGTWSSVSPKQHGAKVKREIQASELAPGATIKLYYETPEDAHTNGVGTVPFLCLLVP